MYTNIIFVLLIFILSLIYLNKFKLNREGFDDHNGIENIKKNKVYFYNFNEKNKNVEEDNNEELINFYKFTSEDYKDKNTSKIVLKLEDNNQLKEFYISFYVKFEDINNKQKQTFIKFISGNNKTVWSLLKFNNNVYVSVNKGYKKFYTPINMKNKEQNGEYYRILIHKEEDKLTFRLNEEIIDDITVPEVSENSFIVFGGAKTNLLTDISEFNGNISNIEYKYGAPEKGVEEKLCKFYPKGSNQDNCESLCNKSNSLDCNTSICKKICEGCKDMVSCQWLDPETKPPNYIPDAPYPIRSTAGNKRVLLEWKKPFEGTNGKIKSYIVIVKESYPSNANQTNDEMIYNFNANDCENCQYEINDLKNTIYYDISVKSQNTIIENSEVKHNISKNCSNIETIAPIGPINIKDYHPSLIESDEEIELIYNKNNKNGGSCRQNNKDGLEIDKLDMSKYSGSGISKRILGENYEDNLNLNNNYLDYNEISDDIKQYLGGIE